MSIGEKKLEGVEMDKSNEEKFAEILAMDEERINDYFSEIALSYEQGRPVSDSIVRLEQEKAIAEDLNGGKPVLIRGVWRTGKTSMVFSIRNHVYHGDNCFFESVDVYDTKDGLEKFKKTLGLGEIMDIIADRGASPEEEKKILEEINRGGKTPLEYLDNYLEEKNEKAFVSLDETIVFFRDQEKLRFLAGLKELNNIHLAIVLHHVAEAENDFAEIFKDFETHYVRPLNHEEIRALVCQPLGGKPIDFTNEAISKIFEITGGRPLEINNLCRAIFDPYLRSKRWKALYDDKDIGEVADAAKKEYGGVFNIIFKNYEKVYRVAFGDRERDIVDRLILEGEIVFDGNDGDFDMKAMQNLINLSFVREEGGRNSSSSRYVINGSLFAEKIKELKNG